ncbi:spore maturation protein SpmA [Breznakibacter xylanolyticus]|uniref:Spore maturation protein SpmA n=1 Tax=Breznakibacter xylanolyticus TaxID=990 RepID=A0A2W7NJ88_9BACT|nr:spore maturation protein [Breznakibacter xylanolyticus]PZX16774.1 spore maturation protein SpmA [Breznakibacter xylanolyticus]
MALNYIWIGFFLIAFVVALGKLIFLGDTQVFNLIMGSTFESAKTGFEISLGLTGVLTLWLGIMKIGEKGGMVQLLSRALSPLFVRLFPQLPKNHPAYGSIMMNLAANMLGLDNAATPMGLKAMKEMQEANPDKESASNPMIMFLVLNTSGLTLVPVSVMVYRFNMGAANPADVFIPILLATFVSTLVGLVAVAAYQRINLFNRVVMAYIGGLCALMGALVWWMMSLPRELLSTVSLMGANILLFTLIIGFMAMAMRKKINIYDTFIEGAKEGFGIAIHIIPFLVAMLVGIGVFRASGAMDTLIGGIQTLVAALGFDTQFIPALPTALMKPLSGGGARGLMVDAMNTYGADSFVGRLSATFQGATDTTFYILAVYFGSVGIKKTRHSVVCGLLADLGGVVAAIALAYMMF